MKTFVSIAFFAITWWLHFAVSAAEAGFSENLNETSRVVIIDNKKATESFTPKPNVINDMVELGITEWTRKKTSKEAWLSLVSTQDVVGLKVFSNPGPTSGTRPAVTAAVIESLLKAGLQPSQIIIWDRRMADLAAAKYLSLADRYGVKVLAAQDVGYDEAKFYEAALVGRLIFGDVDFRKKGEGIGRKSYVTKLLTDQITKVITISPLLNHNYAGISGVFYSLGLGSVDNILRFEMDPERLANALPELYARPEIGDKVVLNIMDALICQYQGEEYTLLHYSAAKNQLWFSADPVALDVLGIKELERERSKARASNARLNMKIYENAALLDLGKADLTKVLLERIEE
ncbi:MAG: DUF362 domain-containing protein [Verrucomicrobiales bacterium]